MKRLSTVIVLALGVAGFGFSFQAGGGISVFVPQSLYLHGQGSVSVDSTLQYAVGLSKFLSIPIGVTYDKIYGFTPGGTASLDQAGSPWFFGDTFMGYAMAKLHLPVSIFYLNLYGGGAVAWNAVLTPVGQSIESYLASSDGAAAVAFPNPSYSAPWGFGWIAGAGVGVAIRKVSVDLNAIYRDVSSPLHLSGTYYAVSGSTATAKSYTAPAGAALLMQGLSIGISASLSL